MLNDYPKCRSADGHRRRHIGKNGKNENDVVYAQKLSNGSEWGCPWRSPSVVSVSPVNVNFPCSTTIQSVGVRATKLKIENGKLKIIKQGKQMIVAKALCSATIQSVGVRAKKLKIENGKLKIIKQGKQMIVAKALCSATIQSVGVRAKKLKIENGKLKMES